MLNNFLGKILTQHAFSLLLCTLMLTACGGGGGGSPTGSTTPGATTGATAGAAAGAAAGGTAAGIQTIIGTVATGAPLVGAAITIKDSAGKTATGTSLAGGLFSIAVSGMKPPFMLVAVPAGAGQTNLYSILPAMDMATTNTQHVNITPVTTLVLYELNGGTDPATMYTGGLFSTATAANVSAKETIVRSKLPANTVNPIFSMMYGNFTAGVFAPGANPNTYDAALDGLGRITAITATGVTFLLAPTYTAAAGKGAVVGVPTIALALTNTTAPYAARTSISGANPARVTATVKDASGVAASGVIVTFSTSDPRDTFLGGINTAITNGSGVATVTLNTSNNIGGTSTVTASSQVGLTAAVNSLNYSIGASAITLSALTLPASISAYGTASVIVSVLNNGLAYTPPTPLTVNFSSFCATTGKATLTASVTTVNGTATANYLDNGCNNQAPGDAITATLMNGVSATGNLVTNSPLIGSIQFVSAVTNPATTPVMITLKGTGGINRSETARLTYRVVDSAGNPVGNTPVTFSLNTALGGLSLSSLSANSDPATGYVSTNVQSGTMSTPVRVTATTAGAAGALISTQSDLLVISTGIPAQDAFSLSATAHNIEGGSWDGVTTTLTARLADHFHNPVPDGTAVYFTSEGGSITPTCTTVGGACSAVLTSQALRPSNGRVTVLARAIGEETFTDLNSNGVADAGEMIDANGISTDMGEAYVDYNEDGIWNPATEPYFDFDGNLTYTGTTNGLRGVGGTATGDTIYNGLLCGTATCSAQKSMDVRGSQVIVFSTSAAAITINGGLGIALPPCVAGVLGAPLAFTVTVLDRNGNSMPVGTTVAFATDNGTITNSGNFVTPDTIACRTGAVGCPAYSASATLGNVAVTMTGDATSVLGACVNPKPAGIFTVTVTSPKGIITTATAAVTD